MGAERGLDDDARRAWSFGRARARVGDAWARLRARSWRFAWGFDRAMGGVGAWSSDVARAWCVRALGHRAGCDDAWRLGATFARGGWGRCRARRRASGVERAALSARGSAPRRSATSFCFA